MRIFSLICDILFALFWLGCAIAVIAGWDAPTGTVVCGFLLASLFNVQTILDNWTKY